MQGQLQQMKSSIANIQQHLRKLECQQAIKLDQIQQNILPESIIHQDVSEKPTPTPKITQTVPNITRTEFYKPSRHHLDDTQMKKTLRQQTHNIYEQQKQNLSKHKQKQKQKQKQKSNKKSRRKQKSLSNTKTKYIYDGARVVYVPPLVQSITDCDHFIGKSQSKKLKGYNQQQYYALQDVQKQYGTQNVVNQNQVLIKTKKSRKKKDKEYENMIYRQHQSKPKKRKTKMSQFTSFGGQNQPYFGYNSNPLQNYMRNPINYTLTQNQTIYNEIQDKKTHKRHDKNHNKLINKTKGVSIRLQCNLKTNRIKPPFIIDWDANTDSQFSEIEL